MDNIEQNGVRFTPEKVVDLDAYEKNKQQAPADGGASAEQKNEPVAQDQEKVADQEQPESSASEPKAEQPVQDQKDDGQQVQQPVNNDEIPLEELYIATDDGELSVSDIWEKYKGTQSELEKIKSDEFLSRFIDFYKEGGDPAQFLKVATAKWEDTSDIQLLKMQFDNENSDLDEEARQIIFERELVSKYGVNPDGTYDDADSREAKVGKQLMRRDAQKMRTSLIEEQKKFMLPQPKSQQQQLDPNAIRQELLKDRQLEGFLKSKSVPVGDGFSYEADPNKVIGMMSNTSEFWNLFKKPDGDWDKAAMAKVFAFALDPKKYDDHILKLGQDVGSESYLKEQKNTVERGKTNVINKATDKDNMMVRNGRIIGNSEELLKAFISQKR